MSLEREASLSQLQAVASEILRQAQDLVEQILTKDSQLTYSSNYLPGSTIGKHLRHARDHFGMIADFINPEEPRILNYDERKREQPMEHSLAAARKAFRDTHDRLETLIPRMHMDDPITLNAVTPYPQSLQTSFGRELWYCCIHAVHHWSMIRVISGELGIKVHPDFGFAPSTLLRKQGGEMDIKLHPSHGSRSDTSSKKEIYAKL